MRGTRVDLAAVASGVLALAMALVYVDVMREQESEPARWFVIALAVFLLAGVLAVVAAVPADVHRVLQ